MMKKKVLVIVAHPDDETIWMGGTLLKHKDSWDMTIISLCRKNDKDRAPKFAKVCESYNARCFMSDLDDSEKGYFKKISEEEIISRVKKFIQGESFDYIFTHGENGEYGHIRHKEVHNAILKMLKDRILIAKKVFFFSYSKKGELACVNTNADKFIRLNNMYLQRKKQLIQEIYGFEKDSFENKCCLNVESFDAEKNLI